MPSVVITRFFPFFCSLLKTTLMTAELPVLCYFFLFYLSTICLNRFALFLFMFEAFIYNTVLNNAPANGFHRGRGIKAYPRGLT